MPNRNTLAMGVEWIIAKPIYGGEITYRYRNLADRFETFHAPEHKFGCARMSCDPLNTVGGP